MKPKTMEDTVFCARYVPTDMATVAQIIDLQNLHMTVCKHHWRV
jgi:hypothetical protein